MFPISPTSAAAPAIPAYWIAVHLPRLPLDALQPSWPEPVDAGMSAATSTSARMPASTSASTSADPRPAPHTGTLHQALPVAVIEHERVVLANGPAVALGVRYGMRRGGVQALSADVVQLDRDLAAESALMTSAALALLHFTPAVAIDAEPEAATVMLDVTASLRLFGGHRALCRAIRARVRQLGTFAQIGSGTTAQGAAWLARQPLRKTSRGIVRPARRAVRAARMTRLLDRLPVECLHTLADPEWLEGIGCRTLGQVRRLPRAGLSRRIGTELLARLDQAYGQIASGFAWFEAPPAFAQRMELPGRVESAEGVLAGAQRLLLALSGWLAVQQAGVTRCVLMLEHERYRLGEDTDSTPVPLRLAQPSRDPVHLSKLLREKLDKIRFHAPVGGLALRVEAMEICVPQSDSLFPEPGAEPAELGRLLDTLVARLGRDNVLQPHPQADHRPERANQWAPVDEPPARGTTNGTTSGGAAPPERPLWLLESPLPLRVHKHRPVHEGPLVMLTRPERIEAGWWDGGLATRDYFIAERDDGLRCWVYRERPGHPTRDGQEDGGEYRWFLHGLFA
ncbi:nucleotidyltransferase [Cupriavidus sp. SHE]|uniref:DNA polymerase Y family protein n=1 Tax=Cupriavidus metallidurans TaxID=119219 RepID=A0A482IYT6_9BURK|nr:MULTISPECIES: DNA polymerase Y family protein [Cupriavidus]KWR86146.1 nucleotidyltransferase [Cupriavidus sp. SHE]QBP12114.1 DNA polymerase Y family protein [Cupriavidus metallidurans]